MIRFPLCLLLVSTSAIANDFASGALGTQTRNALGASLNASSGARKAPGCGNPDQTNLQVWLDGRDLAVGAISSWSNKGALGGAFTQATTAAKPTGTEACNSAENCASFDGGDYLVSDLAASSFKFMHDGSPVDAYVLHVVDGSEPDNLQSLLSTGGISSTTIGFDFFYDDRSAQSSDDTGRMYIARGVLSNVTIDLKTGANDMVSGTWHEARASFESARAGDDGAIYVDGTQEAGAEQINAPSTSDPTRTLHVGATAAATPAFHLTGDIGQVLIYNGAHASPDTFLDCVGGL